ncbi:MAG: hypothetical protein J6V60_05275, partial [Muribaculaceae bacterium]|nr:hypothetical protein [Muribaculaceae bacterium]
VITQNVDDLHERAGSKDVLHLHGELMKIRSVKDEDYVEELSADDFETTPERRGRNGHPMRPHIVFSMRLCLISLRRCSLLRRLMCLS